MVLGYHLILTAYGFWLPNDPRGSWSDFVGAWELLRFGRATKVSTHRSLARKPHNVERRIAAKKALLYPPVIFNGAQARAIIRSFAEIARSSYIVVHTCAIMPDHAHLVIVRHRLAIERIANLLKGASTRRVVEEGIHPLADHRLESGRFPKMWARGQWSVFLDSVAEIHRAIRYVENNPVREGLKPQSWRFVTLYVPSARLGARG